jgi:hypothetical protein
MSPTEFKDPGGYRLRDSGGDDRDRWTDQEKAMEDLVETYRKPKFEVDKPALDQVDAGSWYDDDIDEFAGGGMTRGDNLELVGEEGPELVDLPAGSFVLPLKQLTHGQMLDLKRKGVRGYQSGGIVFDDNQTQTATLPFGLRQMQAGRPITPSRGYLSQQAGLRLPSAQAFQNITPESREVFLDLAAQAGIPRKSFAQELALTVPSGRRLPVARIAPAQRRAIQ